MNTFFSIEHRLSRMEYLARIVGTFLIYVLITLLVSGGQVPLIAVILSVIALFGIILFSIQRLNALRQSRWLSLIAMVPILNLVFILYLVAKSEPNSGG